MFQANKLKMITFMLPSFFLLIQFLLSLFFQPKIMLQLPQFFPLLFPGFLPLSPQSVKFYFPTIENFLFKYLL